MPFTPGRVAIQGITLQPGDTSDPLNLRAEWGREAQAAVDWLTGKLDEGWALGYRSFLLRAPAGLPDTEDLLAAAMWETMPAKKRAALTPALREWMGEHPAAVVYIYTGFRIESPTSLVMGPENAPTARLPDIKVGADLKVIARNTNPWLAIHPRIRMWYDFVGSGDDTAAFLRFQTFLYQRYGWMAGGEATPIELVNGYYRPVYRLCELGPWQHTDTYARQFDPLGQWRFDRERMEVRVSLERDSQNPPAVTEAEIKQWASQGCGFVNYLSDFHDRVLAAG